MRQIRASFFRLAALFGKQRRDRELADEIESNLQLHIDDNLRAGMSPQEARRAALVKIGGVEAAKEEYRDRRGVPVVEHLWQDIRYGARMLLRNSAYTFVAVLALALGIGANTALFSVVYGVLLRPLPYTDGNRLVIVRQSAPGVGIDDMGASVKEIEDYRAQATTLDQVEEYHGMYFVLLNPKPDRVETGVVSAGFFPMLGVKPLLGRTFLPSDDEIGAPPVLVLSYSYWQRAFGGDPHVVGRGYKMNDRMHTVVGVLPPIPQYPRENDVYMPVSACPFRSNARHREMRNMRMMEVFGHLKPGVTPAAAAAEMRTIAARFLRDHPQDYPKNGGFTTSVPLLRDELTQRARPMLLLLVGVTMMVLLICCTNVANLALARVVRREHELSIRRALGASRGRIARQLLTESTLLALAGGALGLLFATFSLDLLVQFIARFTTRALEVQLSTPVLLFTLAISVGTGLLFGSLPAFAAGRGAGSLKLGSINTTVRVHGHRLRSGLLVAEVAFSFILLTAAGLMVRTLVKLENVDAGYRADRVVTMRLPWDWSKYNNDDKLRTHEEEILRRIQALPGISSAALTSGVPLAPGQPLESDFLVEGRPVPAGEKPPRVDVNRASPLAFQTLGIPLLRGRVFSDGDGPGTPLVTVISNSVARHFFGNDDPIGHRVSPDGKTWLTIVGVVGDIREYALDRPPLDTVYLPVAQEPGGNNLSIRAQSDPMGTAAVARRTIQALDPEQAIVAIKTLDQIRGESLLDKRITTGLLIMFAALALVIAATGLAGVTSFLVSQRTREIGIRLALGAQVRQVLGLVLAHGMKLIMLGSAVGVALSLVTSRILQGMLYEVSPSDAITLAAVGAMLIAVSLLASYMPARRATQVDPMIALRCD